jgi:hypothetical protein
VSLSTVSISELKMDLHDEKRPLAGLNGDTSGEFDLIS